MSLRPPRSFERLPAIVTGEASLQAEIMAEKAAALARTGEAVVKALDAWRDAPEPEKGARAYAAAEAVQSLFIQRELMGLRAHGDVVAQLGVPREVLSKIGARPPAP